MAARIFTWLDKFFLQLGIMKSSVLQTARSNVNFVGFNVLDNSNNDSTDVRLGLSPVVDSTSTGTVNDYAPAVGASSVRFTNAAGTTLTGIVAGLDGDELVITAVGNTVTLRNQNAGSQAANRIITGTGADLALTDGQSARLFYDITAARWRVETSPGGGGGGFTAGGDLTGTAVAQTVAKINGTTVQTAGGALATGAVLRATGAATCDWGAVNLASANAVAGTLPAGNQAAQAMGGDCSGTTAACTVAKVNGVAYGAGGALTTGQVPRVTGASTTAYGALDVANANAVTGTLPAGNGGTGATSLANITAPITTTKAVTGSDIAGTGVTTNNATTVQADLVSADQSLFVFTNAVGPTISGFVAPSPPRIKIMFCYCSAASVIFKNEDAVNEATPANRLHCGAAADRTVPQNSMVMLVYNTNSSRWHMVDAYAAVV